jgi:hypothetical protein
MRKNEMRKITKDERREEGVREDFSIVVCNEFTKKSEKREEEKET